MKTHFDENHVIHFQATVHDSFQDIFDYVAEKLMEQGERAVDYANYDACAYRLFDNDKILKCAVGWLIPDEQYNPGFEDNEGGLENVLTNLGIKTRKGEYFTERYMFLNALQLCHDSSAGENFRISFWNRMTDLANKYNLKTDHLDYFYHKYVQSNSV